MPAALHACASAPSTPLSPRHRVRSPPLDRSPFSPPPQAHENVPDLSITTLVSFDSEIRTALDIELLRISESGHWAIGASVPRCGCCPAGGEAAASGPMDDDILADSAPLFRRPVPRSRERAVRALLASRSQVDREGLEDARHGFRSRIVDPVERSGFQIRRATGPGAQHFRGAVRTLACP
jgi:hypothetical protein